jgi:hypothetical protein
MEEQLQLIKRVADSLAEGEPSGERRYPVYREYRNASRHDRRRLEAG